jgi:hypothetical protein
MGLLDRRRRTPTPPAPDAELIPSPSRAGWYGRRFRTSAGVEVCEGNLRALLLEGHDDARVFDARWVGDSPAPDVLFGVRDTRYGVLYVAIWQSGPTISVQREIAVVPTRFDEQAPMPLAGQWKMRDNALASIGHITHFPVVPGG